LFLFEKKVLRLFVFITIFILAIGLFSSFVPDCKRTNSTHVDQLETFAFDASQPNWCPDPDLFEAVENETDSMQVYNECLMNQTNLSLRERIYRAGRLLLMVRNQNQISSQGQKTQLDAELVYSQIMNVCPEFTDEVYILGLVESGYSDRFLFGDWRISVPTDEICPSGWLETSVGCFSRTQCSLNNDKFCAPTSCGYWQIRTVYPGRPTCNELVQQPETGIRWVCDWVKQNWPNAAAYNAGVGGARSGLGQPYANRVYTALELLRGEGNIEKWQYREQRFVYEQR
jgi:hypothetical protein